jgi:hypothetical protein
MTLSFWLKRGKLGVLQGIFDAGTTPSNDYSSITAADVIVWYLNNGGNGAMQTTPVFRDPSAWYHIMLVTDTTQAQTAGNAADSRLRIYVNGNQITSLTTSTMPAQNYNVVYTNQNGVVQNLFRNLSTNYTDGYVADTYFIDGQALSPTSFGAINATTGVWAPIKYTGTYGTNGFHLDFNSYATTAALGTDTSGNGNTWTVNNLSVTAGVTYDSMIDVPTVSATGSNYATLSPIDAKGGTTQAIPSQGNLRLVGVDAAAWRITGSTAAFTSMKIYAEVTIIGNTTTSGGYRSFGVVGATTLVGNSGVGQASNTGWGITANDSGNNGAWTNAARTTLTGQADTNGTVYMLAIDATIGSGSNKIWFGQNNAWFNSGDPAAGTNAIFSNVGDTLQFAGATLCSAGYDFQINFGQTAFAYTPPSGYSALNTYNLPAPSILIGAAHMAATTYTGTGASLTVANTVNSSSFQPDFVWVKGRSGATDHALYDSVRGVQKQIESNQTGAETTETTGLTAFGSTGFTVGALAQMNTSAATYIGWQWKGGGAAVTNTNGTMSAQVSANPTSGCSICSFTTPSGTVNPNTFGHGLGVAPSFVITKAIAVVQNWDIYHVGVGNTARIIFTSGAASTANAQYWNNTTPSSTVVTIGTTAWWGSSTNYIAYCFAPIAGYSAFGSYTGNGSADGPFVFTGFRPRFVLLKSSSAATDWYIYDTSRDAYNVSLLELNPNLAAAEQSGTYGSMDILSNGFKLRFAGGEVNASAATYIYAAFAESPFKNSLAR